MNKYLKIIVIALALVIVGTGISIPVIASASQEAPADEVTEEGVMLSVEGELDVEDMESTDDDAVSITAEAQTKSNKAIGAAIVVGLAAAAGANAMGIAIAKSVEGVSRQPEASGKIQTMLMLGLVFIETAIIYALIVAILVIFVL